jgi:anti-sigma B factor antagonist
MACLGYPDEIQARRVGITGEAVHFFRPAKQKAVGEMRQTTPFRVEIDHIGTTDIVTVRGEIDIVSAPEFEETLSTVGSAVIVDLRSLDFMDSSGLAVLLRRKQMMDGSSDIRLVMKPGIIEKLFRVTGIDQVFPIFSEVEAALDGSGSDSSSD